MRSTDLDHAPRRRATDNMGKQKAAAISKRRRSHIDMKPIDTTNKDQSNERPHAADQKNHTSSIPFSICNLQISRRNSMQKCRQVFQRTNSRDLVTDWARSLTPGRKSCKMRRLCTVRNYSSVSLSMLGGRTCDGTSSLEKG